MKIPTLTTATIIIAIIAIFAVFSANSQQEIKFVEDSAFAARMRPPVPFDHDKHNETAEIEDCSTCHHVYEDGKLVDGEASIDTPCSDCHTLQAGDNPLPLIRLYHLQCKKCHLEKKAGPILCGECHPRGN